MQFSKFNNTELRLEAPLGRAAVHYLLDHSVLDRHIAPSSFLFEAATAAGHLLSNGSTSLAVAHAALPAAMELGRAAQAHHMSCSINAVTGTISITTRGPAAMMAAPHMTATFCNVVEAKEKEVVTSDVVVKSVAVFDEENTMKEEEMCWAPNSAKAVVASAVLPHNITPDTEFASILAHQHQHTGYWLHPTVAESSQQLAMALQASPDLALLTIAVELCSITATLLPVLADSVTAGCSINSGNHASNWLQAGSGLQLLSTQGNRFTSLASWAASRALEATLASSYSSTRQQFIPPTAAAPSSSATTHNVEDIASIIAQLSEVVTQLLGESISLDQPLMAAGLDSVGAVELKNAVSAAFGLELPATVTFDYPTVQALSGYISQNAARQHQSGSTANTSAAIEATRQALLDIAAGVLGTDVAGDQPLMEAGLDSVGSVELRNAVQSAFGVELPATVTFDYPTVDALSTFVLSSSSSLALHPQNLTTHQSTLSSYNYLDSPHTTGPPLTAVSGWAGVAASSPQTAGASLPDKYFSAADLIRPVPLDRWDHELINISSDIKGSGALRMAAWSDGVGSFEDTIFRLSKTEAVGMDPQCRILLEQTWEVLEDGNIMSTPALWPTTGVYAGIVWTEYQVLQEGLQLQPTTASLTGSGLNFSIGRVSYTFGLQGPCVGMDTACSSSLVAIHLAHRGLHAGETNAAVAAGTNFMLVSSTSVHLAQLGSLSLNGRSKTFDASADGYGRGEACVAMVLQRAGDVAVPHALLHGE